MTGRTWTLTFSAPDRIMSVNTNKHWRTTSAVKREWREATFQHVRRAKLPTGLRRIRLDVELRFPTGGRRDALNYYAHVIKPLTDAMCPGRTYTIRKGPRAGTQVTEVGYGLIPDDTAEFLDGPHITIGPVVPSHGFGEVVITITDLSPVPTCGGVA